MRESDLLDHIYGRSGDLKSRFPNILVGPGDDCAVVSTPRGDPVLLTTDQLVESRHYEPGTPLDLIARKAVARSVSDIAAMGGSPRWGLAAAVLAPDDPDADALFDAMAAWAGRFGCPLVGGDVASWGADGPRRRVLTVTIGGDPHPTRGPVLRAGAQIGDGLYVTGALGGSLGSGRHLAFEPRLGEARWLCDTLGADLRAMIDLSDGLGVDAGRLARASGVGAQIRAGHIPLNEGAGWRAAAGDGEDYELLFAAAADADIPQTCPGTGTRITRIGTIVAGSGCTIETDDGERVSAERLGWEHGA